MLNRLIEMGVDEAARGAWSKHWIETGFDAVEARLAHLPGPFALGDKPTLADICIVPQVFNARRFGVDLSRYKRIVALDAAAAKLDAFAAAEPGPPARRGITRTLRMETMHPNDPKLRSFVAVDPSSDFPIQNLPYGVFLHPGAA